VKRGEAVETRLYAFSTSAGNDDEPFVSVLRVLLGNGPRVPFGQEAVLTTELWRREKTLAHAGSRRTIPRPSKLKIGHYTD
jgi:hypothetical protein